MGAVRLLCGNYQQADLPGIGRLSVTPSGAISSGNTTVVFKLWLERSKILRRDGGTQVDLEDGGGGHCSRLLSGTNGRTALGSSKLFNVSWAECPCTGLQI